MNFFKRTCHKVGANLIFLEVNTGNVKCLLMEFTKSEFILITCPNNI